MLFKKKRKYRKKTPKQKEEKELDEMWTKKVKDRDNWTCQICHKKFDKVNVAGSWFTIGLIVASLFWVLFFILVMGVPL